MSRYRDPQLQVDTNYLHLYIFIKTYGNLPILMLTFKIQGKIRGLKTSIGVIIALAFQPPNQLIGIFSHFKFCLADAIHNSK